MSRLSPIKTTLYIKFLEHIGCKYKGQKGDHLVYNKKGLNRPIIFPEDKEIPVFYISSNNKTLNLTTKEYLDLMKTIK